MKNRLCALRLLSGLLLFSGTFLVPGLLIAQAIDPNKSARAAARNDAEFIAENIKDNEDAVFLAQQALERSKDERVKELAQLLVDDHISMLYAMQQLETAGKGASAGKPVAPESNRPEAASVNAKLTQVSGPVFDSVWVSSLLPLQQAKYDELTQAKETVTNPQLRMAVSEALPKVRKHVSQLNSVQKYLAKMALQKRKEAEARRKEEAAREKERTRNKR